MKQIKIAQANFESKLPLTGTDRHLCLQFIGTRCLSYTLQRAYPNIMCCDSDDTSQHFHIDLKITSIKPNDSTENIYIKWRIHRLFIIYNIEGGGPT